MFERPRLYRVQRAGREPLVRFMREALEAEGCRIIYASEPDQAPFVFTFETLTGERMGVVAYAFTATRTPRAQLHRVPDCGRASATSNRGERMDAWQVGSRCADARSTHVRRSLAVFGETRCRGSLDGLWREVGTPPHPAHASNDVQPFLVPYPSCVCCASCENALPVRSMPFSCCCVALPMRI